MMLQGALLCISICLISELKYVKSCKIPKIPADPIDLKHRSTERIEPISSPLIPITDSTESTKWTPDATTTSYSTLPTLPQTPCDQHLVTATEANTSPSPTPEVDKCFNNQTEMEIPFAFDISQTLASAIANMLKDFRNYFQEWNNDDISFNNTESVAIPLRLQRFNYTIDIGDLKFQKFSEFPLNLSNIECNFSNNFTLNIPIPKDYWKFNGDITIDRGNQRRYWGYLFDSEGKYTISLENLAFSFTAKRGFDFHHTQSDDQTEIGITYKKFDIELDISVNDEPIVLSVIDEFFSTIKSSLRARLHETLTTIIHQRLSFLSIYTVCMHPRNKITQKHHSYDSLENYHYYTANNSFNDSWNGVFLKIDSVKIKGLSNFRSIRLSNTIQNGQYTFTLIIGKLHGSADWLAQTNGNHINSRLKFVMNNLTITGTMDENDIRSLNIFFLPLSACGELHNDLTLFAEMILYNKITSIITSSLTQNITYEYNRVS